MNNKQKVGIPVYAIPAYMGAGPENYLLPHLLLGNLYTLFAFWHRTIRFLRWKAQCLCHFQVEKESALLITGRRAAETLFSTTHIFTRVLTKGKKKRQRRGFHYLEDNEMFYRKNKIAKQVSTFSLFLYSKFKLHRENLTYKDCLKWSLL